MIDIKFESKALSKALVSLGSKGTSSAASMAINRVLPGVRTDAKRHIAANAGLNNINRVGRRIKLVKSSVNTLQGSVWFYGSIGLKYYKTAKHKKGKGGGVFQDGEKIKNSFKASINKLKDDYWWRAGKEVIRLWGFTVSQEYFYQKTPEHVNYLAQKRLNKEFGRAIAKEIRKLGL